MMTMMPDDDEDDDDYDDGDEDDYHENDEDCDEAFCLINVMVDPSNQGIGVGSWDTLWAIYPDIFAELDPD